MSSTVNIILYILNKKMIIRNLTGKMFFFLLLEGLMHRLHRLYFNRFVCHSLSVTSELCEFCLPTSAYIHKCTRSICKDLSPCLIYHILYRNLYKRICYMYLCTIPLSFLCFLFSFLFS